MIKILQGNALHLPVKDKSVHSIVTSQPYFGLRAYAGQQEVDWPSGKYSPCTGAPACIEVPAMRSAFGAESTVEAYIFHSLLILRECWRVLRDDGVIFFNIGDSYSAAGYSNHDNTGGTQREQGGKQRHLICQDIQPGNLIGIPARLMLAAQADGWIVRNDCIWKKCSAMPESISGSRWVKHRIKIDGAPNGMRNKDNRNRQGNPAESGGYRSDVANNPTTKYIDCPGCDECSTNKVDCPRCKGTGVDCFTLNAPPMTNEEWIEWAPKNPCPECDGRGWHGYILKRGSFRHTRAHEFVFMLTKQMQYFCDGDAVREKNVEGSGRWGKYNGTATASAQAIIGGKHGSTSAFTSKMSREEMTEKYYQSGRNPRSVLTVDTEQEIAAMVEAYEFELRAALADNRNPSDVLSPRPSSYSGQHFAVFPADLIRSLIKSSTPKKCCPKCGAGYTPMVENNPMEIRKTVRADKVSRMTTSGTMLKPAESSILGYRPTCECNAGAPIPGICLDPFVGSGTTLSVCRELGVNGIGIDISFPYLWEQATHRAEKRVPQEIQKKRIAELPLFCQS